MVNDVLCSMDKGLHTGMVFLDLKKAFDTVNYAKLCAKLPKYGMSDGVKGWTQNYLSERSQCTVCNGVL